VASFAQVSPQNTVYASPIRTTCPAHLLLDFITRTILGEEYRSLSSSLCSFLLSPVTSSLLGPNILLSTLFSAYVPPSMWVTKFHTHTKQEAELCFRINFIHYYEYSQYRRHTMWEQNLHPFVTPIHRSWRNKVASARSHSKIRYYGNLETHKHCITIF
jgi:hypothetical protein